MEVLNLLAIILIPIVSVWVGQFLQDRSEKRKDKMKIFQCLMTYRATGWGSSFEAVAALNSIDIVFVHDKKVRSCWSSLLSKYNLTPSPQILQEQVNAQWKLLESMAICLGYKDKITWENIQNPYFPVGLQRQIENNAKLQSGQLVFAEMISQIQNAPGQSTPFVSTPPQKQLRRTPPMPTLNWIGKDKVVNHHLDVPFRTLEKQYTFAPNGGEDDGNMIIHGDNLDALKALLPMYEGRVKCIYIEIKTRYLIQRNAA